MTHWQKTLNQPDFDNLASGSKDILIKPNIHDWEKMKAGDLITFTENKSVEPIKKIIVYIKYIYCRSNFTNLYQEFGNRLTSNRHTVEESLILYRQIFSEAPEHHHTVLCLELKVVDSTN